MCHNMKINLEFKLSLILVELALTLVYYVHVYNSSFRLQLWFGDAVMVTSVSLNTAGTDHDSSSCSPGFFGV